MALVDTLDEQALLEDILEQSKPPRLLPAASGTPARNLHWLLFTPFRYPPLPTGSRFRSPGDPGVFYGAETQQAACAELGYWRWRLLQDSPALDSLDPMQQTLFQTPVETAAIDLRQPPWSAQQAQWTHPTDYAPCQALARTVRDHTPAIGMIRYASVRDPDAGGCAAVLDPAAFATDRPSQSQTWTLAVFQDHVFWRRDSIFDDQTFEFQAAHWR